MQLAAPGPRASNGCMKPWGSSCPSPMNASWKSCIRSWSCPTRQSTRGFFGWSDRTAIMTPLEVHGFELHNWLKTPSFRSFPSYHISNHRSLMNDVSTYQIFVSRISPKVTWLADGEKPWRTHHFNWGFNEPSEGYTPQLQIRPDQRGCQWFRFAIHGQSRPAMANRAPKNHRKNQSSTCQDGLIFSSAKLRHIFYKCSPSHLAGVLQDGLKDVQPSIFIVHIIYTYRWLFIDSK